MVCDTTVGSRYLPIRRRGSFFRDPFFKDARDDYNHAVRRIVERFNKGLDTKVDAIRDSQCHSIYKTLRNARLNYSTQTAKFKEVGDVYKMVMDVHEFVGGDITVRTAGSTVSVRAKVDVNPRNKEKNEVHDDDSSTDADSSTTKTLHKRFTLPLDADCEKIVSSLSKDAVLSVTIPKRTDVKYIDVIREDQNIEANIIENMKPGGKRCRDNLTETKDDNCRNKFLRDDLTKNKMEIEEENRKENINDFAKIDGESNGNCEMEEELKKNMIKRREMINKINEQQNCSNKQTEQKTERKNERKRQGCSKYENVHEVKIPVPLEAEEKKDADGIEAAQSLLKNIDSILSSKRPSEGRLEISKNDLSKSLSSSKVDLNDLKPKFISEQDLNSPKLINGLRMYANEKFISPATSKSLSTNQYRPNTDLCSPKLIYNTVYQLNHTNVAKNIREDLQNFDTSASLKDQKSKPISSKDSIISISSLSSENAASIDEEDDDNCNLSYSKHSSNSSQSSESSESSSSTSCSHSRTTSSDSVACDIKSISTLTLNPLESLDNNDSEESRHEGIELKESVDYQKYEEQDSREVKDLDFTQDEELEEATADTYIDEQDVKEEENEECTRNQELKSVMNNSGFQKNLGNETDSQIDKNEKMHKLFEKIDSIHSENNSKNDTLDDSLFIYKNYSEDTNATNTSRPQKQETQNIDKKLTDSESEENKSLKESLEIVDEDYLDTRDLSRRSSPFTPGSRSVKVEREDTLGEEGMFKDCWNDFSDTLHDVLTRLQQLSTELKPVENSEGNNADLKQAILTKSSCEITSPDCFCSNHNVSTKTCESHVQCKAHDVGGSGNVVRDIMHEVSISPASELGQGQTNSKKCEESRLKCDYQEIDLLKWNNDENSSLDPHFGAETCSSLSYSVESDGDLVRTLNYDDIWKNCKESELVDKSSNTTSKNNSRDIYYRGFQRPRSPQLENVSYRENIVENSFKKLDSFMIESPVKLLEELRKISPTDATEESSLSNIYSRPNKINKQSDANGTIDGLFDNFKEKAISKNLEQYYNHLDPESELQEMELNTHKDTDSSKSSLAGDKIVSQSDDADDKICMEQEHYYHTFDTDVQTNCSEDEKYNAVGGIIHEGSVSLSLCNSATDCSQLNEGLDSSELGSSCSSDFFSATGERNFYEKDDSQGKYNSLLQSKAIIDDSLENKENIPNFTNIENNSLPSNRYLPDNLDGLPSKRILHTSGQSIIENEKPENDLGKTYSNKSDIDSEPTPTYTYIHTKESTTQSFDDNSKFKNSGDVTELAPNHNVMVCERPLYTRDSSFPLSAKDECPRFSRINRPCDLVLNKNQGNVTRGLDGKISMGGVLSRDKNLHTKSSVKSESPTKKTPYIYPALNKNLRHFSLDEKSTAAESPNKKSSLTFSGLNSPRTPRNLKSKLSSEEKPVPSYVRVQNASKRQSGFAHISSDNVRRMRDVWSSKQEPKSVPLYTRYVSESPSRLLKKSQTPVDTNINGTHLESPRRTRTPSRTRTASSPVDKKNDFNRKSSPSPVRSTRPNSLTNKVKSRPESSYENNYKPNENKPPYYDFLRKNSQSSQGRRSPVPPTPCKRCSSRGTSQSPVPSPLLERKNRNDSTNKFFERNKPISRNSSRPSSRPCSRSSSFEKDASRKTPPRTNLPKASRSHQKIFKRLRDSNLLPDSEAIYFKEEKDRYKMVLDVEEFVPGEIEMLQNDKILVVKGRVEMRSAAGHISVRTFHRKFNIPNNSREEEIDSALSNEGILTIFVPKKKERVIKIELVD